MGVRCYQFLKCISVVWSLLFMMMGGAWLGLVLWVYLDQSNIITVNNDSQGVNYLLYFLMVVGAIVFILGFLGCCGACQESQCMLTTFFVMVFALFCSQVAAGLWVRGNRDRFVDIFTETITASVKHNYGRDDIKTQAFDVIQTNLKCCGSNGVSDWMDSYYNQQRETDKERSVVLEFGVSPVSYNVPQSCCMFSGCNTHIFITTTKTYTYSIYTEGCSSKMLQLVGMYSGHVLYILLAVLLVQVLAMVLSLMLCCTVRRIDTVKG